jgi:ATP-dependent helicase/nuclease subunit A
MELNPSQKLALDTNRDIIVSAGAGSGKTRVLVKRYISLFLDNPDLTVKNVVAITFTEKAAAELRDRIIKELQELSIETEEKKLKKRILDLEEDISQAYIGTIHSFCSSLLGEFPVQAGVDASFGILDQSECSALVEESITESLTGIARQASSPLAAHLRYLLRYFSSYSIKNIISQFLSKRDIIKPHIKRYINSSIEDLLEFETAFHHQNPDSDIYFERINLNCLKSFSFLYKRILEEYKGRKGNGAALDFDDLLIMAADLVEKNTNIQEVLKKRFRFILVDEFQDTDPLQWRLFRILAEGQKPGSLFLVGDPKQSIYGFRRADVRLFYRAEDLIMKLNKNAGTDLIPFQNPASGTIQDEREYLGRITLDINYRSVPAIVDFANYFFSRIMPEKSIEKDSFEVIYEYLVAGSKKDTGGIEIIYADAGILDQGDPLKNLPGMELEAELIARRISMLFAEEREIPVKAGDIALLLRSRTHLKSYEMALSRHKIPFITVQGIGFYERQEVFDISNFLQFIIYPDNDPSLLGLLRCPFLKIADDLLVHIANCRGDSLWERLKNSVKELIHIPEKEIAALGTILDLLKNFIYKSRRISLTELIKEFLLQTGAWAALSFGEEGLQRKENIEKLLARARQYEASGFHSIIDFTEDLLRQIEKGESEGEAIQPQADIDAVKILTIHKSKGLEFPIVFLPGISNGLNLRTGNLLVHEKHGIAIKPSDPKNKYKAGDTSLFNYLLEPEKAKMLSEEKRLFYVGVTRAENLLILCTTKQARKRKSRNDWLEEVFSINKAISENSGNIEFEIEDNVRTVKIIKRIPLIPTHVLNDKSLENSGGSIEERTQPEIECATLPDGDYTREIKVEKEHRQISVTQLMNFEKCPVEYYFSQILGWEDSLLNEILPEETDESGPGNTSSSGQIRGTLIHGLLQEYFIDPAIPPEDIIDNLLGNEISISREEKTKIKKEAIISWNRIKKSRTVTKLASFTKKHPELPFNIRSGDNILMGRVDLCYRDNSGNWIVADFKTGWIPDVNVKKKSEKYRIQMDIYALFLNTFAPDQKNWQVDIYYPDMDRTFSTLYNMESIKTTRQKINNLLDQENNFQENNSAKNALYGLGQIKALLKKHCPECTASKNDSCEFRKKIEHSISI